MNDLVDRSLTFSCASLKTVNGKLTHYAPVINVVMGCWKRGYLLDMDSGKQSWS